MINNYDCSQIENYDELRKLQLTQLEILKFVDAFCRKNNLIYSLAYGTALGAVRHGGFIPWDDDMDICMPREDYDKFLSLWKDTDGYFLQNHEKEPGFTQSFTKIRKKNTAFVQEVDDLSKKYFKGIFIDIFPFDRVPKSKYRQKLQILHAMKYNLYTRGYAPKNFGVITAISKFFLMLTPKGKYDNKANKYLRMITRYSSIKDLCLADLTVFSTMKLHYSANLFENNFSIRFENCEFSIVKDYDYFLRKWYDDYMKFPPVEEQTWSHHPIYLSFTEDYEKVISHKEVNNT